METLQALNDTPYNMRIKEVCGREYRAEKVALKNRLVQSNLILKERGSLYRALRLPPLPTEAGKILRKADRMRFLGAQVMVVGTNALIAYAVEANGSSVTRRIRRGLRHGADCG